MNIFQTFIANTDTVLQDLLNFEDRQNKNIIFTNTLAQELAQMDPGKDNIEDIRPGYHKFGVTLDEFIEMMQSIENLHDETPAS